MKILQVIQKPQLRGAEIFASQLSNQLINLGHEVTMVSIFEGHEKLPFEGEMKELNRPLKKRFFDWKGLKLLAEIIAKKEPDIIQANAGDTLKFTVLSKLIFGWKQPIVFRNANKMGDFIDSSIKYLFNKILVNKLTHVLSVSELCRKDFLTTFRFEENKTTTITIGIDTREIKSIPPDLVSVFNRGPVLINVGSLVPEKNHIGLIRIFKKLHEENKDVQLVIIGKGKTKSNLDLSIKKWGLENDIHFLGNRSDVLEIINCSKAFLLPSLVEGLPAVILEAQYCKTPVIANNVGGISEVIRNNETGILIEKGNETAFLEGIHFVLNPMNQSKLEQIKQKAFTQIINDFTNEQIVEKFIMAYHKLLHENSSININ